VKRVLPPNKYRLLVEMSKKDSRSFDLDNMKAHAKELGGKCLSKKYVNSTYKLKWRCKNGHFFEASPLEIIGKKNSKGSWCPECDKEMPEDSNLLLNLDDIDLD
jgi:hypothetical protein